MALLLNFVANVGKLVLGFIEYIGLKTVFIVVAILVFFAHLFIIKIC